MPSSYHCLCGAVAFEIDAVPNDVYVCHCSICRRYTGSNGIAVVIVPRDAFRWIKGEADVAQWTKPDADWQAWFCKHCGSAVPGTNDASTMFIPAGLIGDNPRMTVAHHIWVDSRADWEVIADGGKLHPQQYTE